MAIALDNTAQASTGATSLTFAYTCTGSNLILFVGVEVNNGSTGVTASYNGVSLTQIGFKANATDGNDFYLFMLVNPATGSNNIVLTTSTGGNLFGMVASYTGAAQTGQPDATSTGGITTTGSYTQSVTVVINNSWLIMFGGSFFGAVSGGTGTTLRQTSVPIWLCDSNGARGTGTQSLNLTASSSRFVGVMASFAPFTAPAVNSNFFNLF